MIWAFVLRHFGWVAKLPKEVFYAIAVAAILLCAWWWHKAEVRDAVREAVEADRKAANLDALERARSGDERAQEAAQGKLDEVTATNERASNAARNSDDPLKSGFDSLRGQ